MVNFLPRLQEVLKSKPLVNFLDYKKNPCLYYHAIYKMFTYFASFTGYEDDTKVVSSLAKMRKLSFNQNLLHTDTKTDIVTSRLNWHKGQFGEEKNHNSFCKTPWSSPVNTHILCAHVFVFPVPIRIDRFTTVVTILFLSI